eukprot:scaffold12021_cov70-Phaeocystis_antarctica.AAC.1
MRTEGEVMRHVKSTPEAKSGDESTVSPRRDERCAARSRRDDSGGGATAGAARTVNVCAGAVGQPQRQRRRNGGEGERNARQGCVASEDMRG